MALGPAYKNKPAGTTISYPSDGTDKVFARVVALVRAGLHASTVLGWDNPAVDQTPPGTDGPPWIRLTPSPGTAAIYARTPAGVCHRMPMTITIETSVGGTNVAPSQQLWGALLAALFPGRIMDAQLQYLGVSRIAIVKPAWGSPKADATRCEAEGSIELQLAFTTPE